MKIRSQRQSGLSKVEITLGVASVALLLSVALVLPPRGGTGGKSRRVQCMSNLKQIGLADLVWANQHDDQFPFASTSTTSSMAFANSPQVFRHFAILSNELVTPMVLVCPTDKKRVPQTDFAKLSNADLSYFVGLDANPSKPQSMLSGDRNITGGTLSNGFLRLITPTNEADWTPEIHNRTGNIGFADGSVQGAGKLSLQQHLAAIDLPLIRLAVP